MGITYLGTSLEFPESLISIKSDCFGECPNLTELTFHEGLEEIGSSSFDECRLLKNLVLPSTLKNMPYSFQGNTLENLVIGGEGASFLHSGKNGIIGISAKNMTIRGGTIGTNAFYGRTDIETVTLNGEVKFDSTDQFQGCSNLSNITIDNGVTNIPANCFYNCAIENVILPDSVLELGQNSFSGCTSLKNIKI